MRLIDADELIINLMDRGIESIQTDDFYEIKQAVADMPTIDAELVRHGHWIVCNDLTSNNMYLDENEYYRCSECGKTKGHKSNYCPNCGAMMEGNAHETH